MRFKDEGESFTAGNFERWPNLLQGGVHITEY